MVKMEKCDYEKKNLGSHCNNPDFLLTSIIHYRSNWNIEFIISIFKYKNDLLLSPPCQPSVCIQLLSSSSLKSMAK